MKDGVGMTCYTANAFQSVGLSLLESFFWSASAKSSTMRNSRPRLKTSHLAWRHGGMVTNKLIMGKRCGGSVPTLGIHVLSMNHVPMIHRDDTDDTAHPSG